METTDEDLELAFQSLTSSSKHRATSIAVLANASKQNVSVRHRLANPTALKSLIEVIECSINDDIETLDLALRCIANACADNNAARDAIAKMGFSWALQCLHLPDTTIQILTTKVLYNICADDHENAQKRCYETGIHFALITFCAKIEDVDECSFAVDVLLWIVGQKAAAEPTLSQPIPEDSLRDLLSVPALYADTADLETLASLAETVLVFGRDPVVQAQIITTKQLGKVWRILELLQTRAVILDPAVEDQAEDLKILLALSMSLVWCLSDTAALPDFAKVYSLGDVEVKAVIGYIQARGGNVDDRGDPNGLQLTAACQTVGNLLWALRTETYAFLVTNDQLHQPLLEIVVHTGSAKEDAGILHSVAGLLIQLSRPSVEVRQIVGNDALAQAALERLCRHDMPNIQQEGIKLLRALGRECPANQERFAALAREAVVSASENSNAQAVSGAIESS